MAQPCRQLAYLRAPVAQLGGQGPTVGAEVAHLRARVAQLRAPWSTLGAGVSYPCTPMAQPWLEDPPLAARPATPRVNPCHHRRHDVAEDDEHGRAPHVGGLRTGKVAGQDGSAARHLAPYDRPLRRARRKPQRPAGHQARADALHHRSRARGVRSSARRHHARSHGARIAATGTRGAPSPIPSVVPSVDAVVCAAAESMDVSPRPVRRALLAACRRALEVGFTLESLDAALAASLGASKGSAKRQVRRSLAGATMLGRQGP